MIKSLLLTLAVAVATVSGYSQQVEKSSSLFNSKELGVSLASGYVVNTSAPFQQDYSFNLTAGASYFLTKYFGAEVNVPFYQTEGVSVSEVQFGLLARVPVGFVAPYVGVGGVGSWKAEDSFAYIGKAGLELRTNSKWGVFVEGQYRNNNFEWERGSIAVVGGVKLVF